MSLASAEWECRLPNGLSNEEWRMGIIRHSTFGIRIRHSTFAFRIPHSHSTLTTSFFIRQSKIRHPTFGHLHSI